MLAGTSEDYLEWQASAGSSLVTLCHYLIDGPNIGSQPTAMASCRYCQRHYRPTSGARRERGKGRGGVIFAVFGLKTPADVLLRRTAPTGPLPSRSKYSDQLR
jgi:hypothetical protein